MNPIWRSLPRQFKELFDRLSPAQRASLTAMTLLTVIAIAALMIWANRPQYTILFTDLSSSDAAKIRDRLQDEKVKYHLQEGGSTILVPSDRVYDLRLQLASEGIPSQPGIGYEIFDRTNLGMSDFVQKLNYRRALEGELARTITSISEVEQARVHLVIPEPALFKEDEKQTTASVVLKIKGRTRLAEEQVRGIATLVARSVEGLEPDNVTILDSNGNLLSGMRAADASLGLSSTQMELQNKVENYLAAQAQSMLDGVLGAGRSIVRVSAELDFQKIERTSEIYDPESAVVRSEELMESTTNEVDSSPSKEANSLTNYEINKTVEHLVNNGGSIKRLSTAVIVDGVYKAGADGQVQYAARNAKEMAALGNMVRGAIGLRADRGDVLEITNIAFDKESFESAAADWAAAEKKDFIVALLPKAILGLVLIMLMLMIRKFLHHSLKLTKSVLEMPPAAMTAGGFAPQLMPGDAAARFSGKLFAKTPEGEMSDEAREAALRKKQITEFAKNQPEAATTLLKSWLLEK